MRLKLDKLKELIEADQRRQAAKEEIERKLQETYKLKDLSKLTTGIIFHVSALTNLPPTESIFE